MTNNKESWNPKNRTRPGFVIRIIAANRLAEKKMENKASEKRSHFEL